MRLQGLLLVLLPLLLLVQQVHEDGWADFGREVYDACCMLHCLLSNRCR